MARGDVHAAHELGVLEPARVDVRVHPAGDVVRAVGDHIHEHPVDVPGGVDRVPPTVWSMTGVVIIA